MDKKELGSQTTTINGEKYKRRFSLEDDFMNYNIDDLLFGAMYYLSTYHPKEKKLYLTKKNFKKNKKIICELCELNAQSLRRHIEKLKEKGLIQECDIVIGDKKEIYPSYTFQYDAKTKYQIIENEMLWYIVSTRNRQAVEVYVWLLNKFLWKQESEETFIFTNKDIMKAIGYSGESANALVSKMITNILESFKREGVINYSEFYEEQILNNGSSIPVPKKRLLKVVSSKAEMN